jgi:2-enoate reductase
VIIVGGGIGGMETARVLKLRGHTPIIYEKSGVLGGTFIPASSESYKGKLRDLLEWYRRQMKEMNIEIHLNERIGSASEFGDLPVIIATGAVANRIPVKGIERGIQAVDYLLGKEPVGQNVVIIGGGLTGCEIAYDLYLQGKTPTIVEMKDDLIAMKGVCLANSSYLRDFFKANKVKVHLETRLNMVHNDGVSVVDKDGKMFKINADSVILSTGYRPNPLVAKGKNVHVIGDAAAVGNLRTVIWQAWDVAMKL